jgi:alpha-L-fucosidase
VRWGQRMSFMPVTMVATLFLLLLVAATTTATIYEPTWDSLDTRATPEWFYQDKFGMFTPCLCTSRFSAV